MKNKNIGHRYYQKKYNLPDKVKFCKKCTSNGSQNYESNCSQCPKKGTYLKYDIKFKKRYYYENSKKFWKHDRVLQPWRAMLKLSFKVTIYCILTIGGLYGSHQTLFG